MQVHSLMPFVTSRRHLVRAARECMRRCSSPGSDRISWMEYRRKFASNIDSLRDRLIRSDWRPHKTREAEVQFITGKLLQLQIPTVEDRIVHRAMRNAWMPILVETVVPPWVAGFIPKRNRLTSVRHAAAHIAQGSVWVANVDVAQVSSNISVDELCDLVGDHISDGSFLRLLRIVLEGLPSPMALGSGLSPSLIHFRLAPVDHTLAAMKIVRFADTYCAFCSTRTEAEDSMRSLIRNLAVRGMIPAERKSWIRMGMNAEDLFLVDG